MADRALAGDACRPTLDERAEHGTNILAAPAPTMNSHRPPTLDPVAAARWERLLPVASPWLHEEVARRMEARLGLILRTPARWLHWAPLSGGRAIHAALCQRYPQAVSVIHEPEAAHLTVAQAALAPAWWKPSRWVGPRQQFGLADTPVDMVWANMALHRHADPESLIRQWHQALAVDGFLMFSCLGPDTLRELRMLYQAEGWPPPGHEFTDMHDWGDMLVHAGFAEPVMDMERITLSFGSPKTLLAELRELGRNLHLQRFAGLRGRTWRQKLEAGIQRSLASPGEPGRYQITFEIVYGHAFKPTPRFMVRDESHVPLADLRSALKKRNTSNDSPH